MAFRPMMVLMALVPLLPACVSAPVVVPAPAAPRPQPTETARFAEFISVPGQAIATHPNAPLPALKPPVEVVAAPKLLPPPVEPPTPDSHVTSATGTDPFHFDTLPAGDPMLVSALRAYLDGRPDTAVERLKGYDKPNQEMLLRLLPAVALAGKAELSGRSPTDAAILGTQLDAAADAVAKVAPLVVKKACFVVRAKQYGDYDPVPDGYPFLPGGSALVYLEVQNAPSLPTPIPAGGNGFVTRLSCGLQLLDAAGAVVDMYDKTERRMLPVLSFHSGEFFRSKVKDYMLALYFDLPKTAGSYTLMIEIRDPSTGRRTRHPVPFTVAAAR